MNVLQDKKSYMKEELSKGSSEFGNRMGSYRSNPLRENISGQRATIAKICEEGKISSVIGPNKVCLILLFFFPVVTSIDTMIHKLFGLHNTVGLQKILQLLTSEESDVQVHAVKVVANLAAEGAPHLPIISTCLK